jgi:GNAT superfamily N-acetyltransferase
MQLPVKFREIQETDLPFVFNSWLKSYRNSKEGKLLKNDQYFLEQKNRIEALLEWSKVVVASDPEDEWHVFGYAVATQVQGTSILHYVYVKQPFRKLGIGKALVNAVSEPNAPAVFTTHPTSSGRFLRLKKYEG